MEWYFHVNGQRRGPMGEDEAQQFATNNPESKCWREGWAQWVPSRSVDQLINADRINPPPAPIAQTIPAVADEIDYVIYGEEMQFVEVELDPHETVISEAGAMMYKDSAITMDTIFGDGSQGEQTGGFMGRLLGAGKRLVTGEGLFTTLFTHEGEGKARISFAAPFPGKIIALDLSQYNGRIICQKDSFLAGAKGVSLGIHFQKKILTGLFGGEGFIMQKLEGDGLVFIHAGGTIKAIDLRPRQVLHVDTGCLVALTDNVKYDVEMVRGVKSMFFGGEGMFFATLTGPGKVWLQSLPFSRMAGRIVNAAKGGKGEGSILGGLGDLLDGDND